MRTLLLVIAAVLTAAPLSAQVGATHASPMRTQAAPASDLPVYLRDRGEGMATSMFGTYVRKGELLVYPFFEWYADSNFEYTPKELGYIGDLEHRGRYRASEGLIFFGYGLTNNLALEFEAAVISAEVEKAPSDISAMPSRVKESGLGDVEMQLRWRFAEETGTRPEVFTFFETVFPLQRDRHLIGTSAWEYKLGFGLTRGFGWGTTTFRVSGEYAGEESKFDAGEYAVEYLKRLSPGWRIVGALEGNQLDEVALITEVQWHFHRRAFLKVNNGWGLTTNATDFAPEIGLLVSF
jgi:hypothetical protein